MLPFHWRCSSLLMAAACCAGCWSSDTPPGDQGLPLDARPDVSRLRTGPELYQALCTPCHGVGGAADGPGAQSLYPPARNFRTQRFRLVSTDNLVPTRADIDRVIAEGMPGTSMRAFSELSPAQRGLLVDEVLLRRRQGEKERVQKSLRALGEAANDVQVESRVRERTTPGSVVIAPPLSREGSDAVERGRKLYFRQGCQACHGADGIGAADLRLVTDEGIPTRGRDLVHEPFKGGHSRGSVYLRIALGMPGTPMPASRTLSPQELADLTEFSLSLSREPKRLLTNDQRRRLATGKAYLQANP